MCKDQLFLFLFHFFDFTKVKFSLKKILPKKIKFHTIAKFTTKKSLDIIVFVIWGGGCNVKHTSKPFKCAIDQTCHLEYL
jgi:hypothetical protein